MKAISLWQPWASAIALGLKGIETRSWSTNYRGPLAIHAALKRSYEQRAFFESETRFIPEFDGMEFSDLPFGAIVATCRLVGCFSTNDREAMKAVSSDEDDWGDFQSNRYGWVLAEISPLRRPIPYRGAQGFFDVANELLGEDA